MVIKIRDAETREIIDAIASFISFIWTERFSEYGDFELELPITQKNLDLFKMDRYLQIPTSTNLMIVEKIEIKTTLKISGRSLESLWDRRIQEKEYVTPSDGMYTPTLMYRIGNYAWVGDVNRKVPYLANYPSDSSLIGSYVDSSTAYGEKNNTDRDRTLLKSFTITRGDNVYDILKSLAEIDDLGFRYEFYDLYLTEKNRMLFYIYDGTDKSDSIIFSENMFNLSNSSYKESMQNLKTTAYVAGQGEGEKRTVVTISRSDKVLNDQDQVSTIKYKNIFRREMWVDARDLQKESKETNAAYKLRLKDRGIEKMVEKIKEYSIDGEIFDSGIYKLKEDYGLGDIVRITNDFFSAKVKITEVIQSWDSSGYKIYPTFKIKEIDGAEIESSINLDD